LKRARGKGRRRFKSGTENVIPLIDLFEVDRGEDGVAREGEVGPALDVGVAKGLGARFGFGAPEFFGDGVETNVVDIGDAKAGVDGTGVVDEIREVADLEARIVVGVARNAPT
jgi:hypothetical protein